MAPISFSSLRNRFRANLSYPPLAGLYQTRNSHLAGNSMRRFTRLTSAVSKKLEKQAAMQGAVLLLVQPRASQREYRRSRTTTSPGDCAGLADRLATLQGLIELIKARAPKPNRPKIYKKRDAAQRVLDMLDDTIIRDSRVRPLYDPPGSLSCACCAVTDWRRRTRLRNSGALS